MAGVNPASDSIIGVNIVGSNNEMYHTTSFDRSPVGQSYYPDPVPNRIPI
jgi:hypothetical protein